jgi:uridine monophosphate synthetase
MIYPRKETKQYGTKARIEGVFQTGERAVIIDDLITTGGSKLEGIEKLASAGLTVSDIVVLIDRRAPGENELAQHGYALHSVLTLNQLLDYYEQTESVPVEKILAVRRFLRDAADH